jgi:RNA polymerase sigma-70 factor (ECF subfamily)
MAETEAVLLRRFARMGDAEAFAEITRRHAGLVYGAALRILADVDRASDVAQETFLQLTKDAATVTDSLPGWLHRVATHKAIDQMRREAARRQREEKYARRLHETAEWRDISPCVDEGLNELDPELRDVLILHFLEGRTTREIAGAWGVSQATISRRVDAGIEQLRAGLRRRGIVVAVGMLSTLLGTNAVKAAPPLLLTELGKMALVGGSAALSSAGVGTAAASLVATVKANAVAIAAVVVIGAGSVVTYREATRPSGPTKIVAAPARRARRTAPVRVPGPSAPTESRPAPAPVRSQAAREWEALMKAALSQTAGPRGGASTAPPALPPQTVAATDQQETAPPAAEGGMVGGFGMAGSPQPQPDNPDTQALGGAVFFGMASSGGTGFAAPAPPPEPNHPEVPPEP